MVARCSARNSVGPWRHCAAGGGLSEADAAALRAGESYGYAEEVQSVTQALFDQITATAVRQAAVASTTDSSRRCPGHSLPVSAGSRAGLRRTGRSRHPLSAGRQPRILDWLLTTWPRMGRLFGFMPL